MFISLTKFPSPLPSPLHPPQSPTSSNPLPFTTKLPPSPSIPTRSPLLHHHHHHHHHHYHHLHHHHQTAPPPASSEDLNTTTTATTTTSPTKMNNSLRGHASTLIAQKLTLKDHLISLRLGYEARVTRHPQDTRGSEVASLQTRDSDVRKQRSVDTKHCLAGPQIPAPRVSPAVVRCPRAAGAFRNAASGSLSVRLSIFTLLLAGAVKASEFPDRECCDSVPPPPPNYHQATSTTTTTTPAPLPGHNTSVITVSHGVSGVINCIEARHQCRNDGQCRDVLDMLHKICGPELVACATVTPGKCKTLLRTLGQYDYMKSCTCGEPHIDFNCYTFREMIFNHPCSLVETPNEQQTYMQTCMEADADCKNNVSCLKNYMEFIDYCGYRGIACTSQQSDKCNESWQRIRTSPHFGCYCPVQARPVGYAGRGTYEASSSSYSSSSSILAKKQSKCMEFYNSTHENPCLVGQKDVGRATMVETSQAMCHVALEQCQGDAECSKELDNINTWCEHSHCEPDRCRNALQDFYQRVKVVRRLQVAFCVCRQSDHDGECLMAMRKLHPTCAERHTPRDPMQCHKIAEQCRKTRVCRTKLQEYEQKCAADAMTGLCSNTHRSCQQAVMNILGTELHATCVCKGTDFLHQQDCYTWQKLLWSNPCVIESHLKLHEEINSGASDNLDDEFRRFTPPITTSTPAPYYGPPTPYDPEHRGSSDYNFGNIVYRPKSPSLGPQTPENTEDDSTWGNRRPGVQIGGSNRVFGGEGRGGIGMYKPGERQRFPDNGENPFGRSRGNGGVGIVFGRPTNAIPHNGNVGWGGRNVDLPYGRGGFSNHRGTGIPIPSQETHLEGGWEFPALGRGRPGSYVPPEFTEEDTDSFTRAPHYPPNSGHFNRKPPVFMPVTPTPPSPHAPPRTAGTDSSSTTVTPTTTPTRACIMKDASMETVMIPEGTMKRLFRGDADCSELCTCPASARGKEHPGATCIALSCVESRLCNTTSALYPHTAPYYWANRGLCMCYGGRFICQKPMPEEYSLGPGIYLFLGYSQGEVEILKPHTSVNEHEAIKVLENVLVRDYNFQCELKTKHHIGENFIVVAKLQVNRDAYITPFMRERREKEVCAGPLEEIAEKINARPRHDDIRTDAILSMFVLATVEVNLPEPHTSPSHASTASHANPIVYLVLLGVHLVIRALLLPLRHAT